jgi:hypothetical protein
MDFQDFRSRGIVDDLPLLANTGDPPRTKFRSGAWKYYCSHQHISLVTAASVGNLMHGGLVICAEFRILQFFRAPILA